MKLFVILLITLFNQSSFADIIDDGSAISNASNTISFSELGLSDGTVVTDQYEGVTFSPFLEQTGCCGPADGIDNAALGGFGSNQFTMYFDTVLSAASFNFIMEHPGETTFTAFFDDQEVESFTTPTHYTAFGESSGTIYGFENILFNSIQVSLSENHRVVLDNLSMRTAQNAPSSHSLMTILGLGLMLGAFRRKK